MKIEVHKVTVLQPRNGPDIIYLDLDLPNGCWPFDGKTEAKITVAGGTGKDYVAAHFDKELPVEIITI